MTRPPPPEKNYIIKHRLLKKGSIRLLIINNKEKKLVATKQNFNRNNLVLKVLEIFLLYLGQYLINSLAVGKVHSINIKG